MTSVSDATLSQMVDAIVDEVSPERVILFGSQARGDQERRSDVDLLVIQSEPFNAVGKRDAQSVRLSKRLARFPVSTDILLYARDEVRLLAGLVEPRCRASSPRGQGSL